MHYVAVYEKVLFLSVGYLLFTVMTFCFCPSPVGGSCRCSVHSVHLLCIFVSNVAFTICVLYADGFSPNICR